MKTIYTSTVGFFSISASVIGTDDLGPAIYAWWTVNN